MRYVKIFLSNEEYDLDGKECIQEEYVSFYADTSDAQINIIANKMLHDRFPNASGNCWYSWEKITKAEYERGK